MTNPNTLNELRALREVLGSANAFVLGLNVMRNLNVIADIAPDLDLAGISRAAPEIQQKLHEHFQKHDRCAEMEGTAEGLLADAVARLDAVVVSLGGEVDE